MLAGAQRVLACRGVFEQEVAAANVLEGLLGFAGPALFPAGLGVYVTQPLVDVLVMAAEFARAGHRFGGELFGEVFGFAPYVRRGA